MSELDKLIRFAAVGNELSFSRAARTLRVDQPWLSRQVQQLEEQLGFPLFSRTTRKVTLTPEGEILLESARELAAVASQTHEAMKSLQKRHSEIVLLGVNPYSFWLPFRQKIINKYQEIYPCRDVEVISNYSPRLLSKVRKKSLDVALIPVPGAEELSDLEALIVHRSPLSLLVPPEDPLSKRKSISTRDLEGKKFASTNPKLNPSVYRETYGKLLAFGAIPVVVPEGQPAIPHYARAARLMIVSHSWPESNTDAPADFVHIKINPAVGYAEYALVRRRERPSSLLQSFWSVAQQIAADHVQPTSGVKTPAPARKRFQLMPVA